VEGRIPGTGIGLAGAREIIEQHGGRITARRRESGGTSFEFRLPLTSGGSLDPIPAEYVGPDV
jgi:two-component system sensor kinase FixL